MNLLVDHLVNKFPGSITEYDEFVAKFTLRKNLSLKIMFNSMFSRKKKVFCNNNFMFSINV